MLRLHFFGILLMTFLVSLSSFGSSSAQTDFSLEIQKVESKNTKAPLTQWILKVTPEPKHHINVAAPMGAFLQGATQKIKFAIKEKKKSKIEFEGKGIEFSENAEGEVSLFLCDDAKTFCIKKSKKFKLAPTSQATQAAITESAESSGKSLKTFHQKKNKKDHAGFWDNAPEAAFEEAKKTKKPLLIDFYGIWCPPCNLFNEQVFPTAQFRAGAKAFVLLKIDADQKLSWPLKVHFRIGGYPTIIFAKLNPAKPELPDEIDRVVGFIPRDAFIDKMKVAAAHQNETLEMQVVAKKVNYLKALKKLIETREEQDDQEGGLKLAEEGLRASPDDLYFKLFIAAAKVNQNSSELKSESTRDLLKMIWEKRQEVSSETLIRVADIVISKFEAAAVSEKLAKEYFLWTGEIMDSLSQKVDPRTLFVSDHWYSIADLAAARLSLTELKKDETQIKEAREATIQSYLKLIRHMKGQESRGLHLEIAYFYRQNKQVEEAKKIYARFIKKYPQEFTFYFPAASMYLELKDLKSARAMAEKALQYSYGDNRLRAMDRLAKVMIAQGEYRGARERAEKILAEFPEAEMKENASKTRSMRYIQNLKKTIEGKT